MPFPYSSAGHGPDHFTTSTSLGNTQRQQVADRFPMPAGALPFFPPPPLGSEPISQPSPRRANYFAGDRLANFPELRLDLDTKAPQRRGSLDTFPIDQPSGSTDSCPDSHLSGGWTQASLCSGLTPFFRTAAETKFWGCSVLKLEQDHNLTPNSAPWSGEIAYTANCRAAVPGSYGNRMNCAGLQWTSPSIPSSFFRMPAYGTTPRRKTVAMDNVNDDPAQRHHNNHLPLF